MSTKNTDGKDVMAGVLPEIEGGDVAPKPKPLIGINGQPLKKTYGRAGNGYSFYVHLDEYRVFFGEIPRAALNALIQSDKDMAATGAHIAAAQKAEKLSVGEAEAKSFASLEVREAAHREFIKKHIMGWDLPADDDYWPCTPENVDDLELSDIITITSGVIQKKLAGQEAAGFLATR